MSPVPGDDLSTSELFDSVPEATRAEIRDLAEDRTFERGDLVFSQGDAAGEVFFVRSGLIAIAARAPDGRETVVAVLGEQSLFGELALFDGAPRSADARALDDTVVAAIPYDTLHATIDDDPALLRLILRILAQRLRRTDQALADSIFLDVTARTAKRLLALSDGRDEFDLPLTQEELAGLVGASRERVNKAIATFVRLEWLVIDGRNRYRILDRDAMDERASL
ncbi:MAG: Crp/Fnr family transcriptional regulator [Acidimicrobiia bacterium]